MTYRQLRIGTRGSDLALWQAHYVAGRLEQEPEIIIIKTLGDRIQNVGLHDGVDAAGRTGFFTKEIEAALIDERVDVAIHSYKDLPIEEPPELEVVAVPERGPVRDVIVCRTAFRVDGNLWGLPEGARLGTASLRRKAQVLSKRPDLNIVELRGNVPTRFNKVTSGELDAVVLAEAGLHRLGLDASAADKGITLEPIAVTDVCPAPSQGALAIQVRADDRWSRERVAPLHDPAVARAVDAERSLLSRFGGGCHLPLGVYCITEGDELVLTALVASPNGDHRIEAGGRNVDPAQLVAKVHDELVRQGAAKYL